MASAQDVAFASSVRELGQEAVRPCFDPECGGMAEPENDGDHRYWECMECGYAFGYERIETSLLVEDADGNCSVGVPADIRRAASGVHDRAQSELDERDGKVDLGLTIGRRPGI